MINKVPTKVSNSVKKVVYTLADQVKYLAQGRTENGVFMDKLISNAKVGGVLVDYMPRADIKTYIKDAILNRYSKDKKEQANQTDNKELIKLFFKLNANKLEHAAVPKVSLYKTAEAGIFIVVAEGTYLKWETAFRKAILYGASKPFFKKTDSKIMILLKLFASQKIIPESDKRLLHRALAKYNATAYIYGEP